MPLEMRYPAHHHDDVGWTRSHHLIGEVDGSRSGEFDLWNQMRHTRILRGDLWLTAWRAPLSGPAGSHRDSPISRESMFVELRRRLLEDRDLVIGSRYVDGGSVVGWPFWRLVLSRAGSLYAGTILGLKVGDLTGGFKGWTRPALEAVRVEGTHSDGYAFQIEITYRAVMAGALVDEVPIRFAERERGVSKMGPGIVLEAVRRVPGFKVRKPEVGRVGTGVRMRS